MDHWDAKHYKTYAQAQQAAALEVLRQIPFSGTERVLDIGCGDGKITQQIATWVPQGEVIGIDLSLNMIRQAKEDYASQANLQFLEKNAEDFHFDSPFDIVTSFFALHWVQNHDKLLNNIHASLKPGGRLLFLIVSGSDERIGSVFMSDKWIKHTNKMLNHFKVVGVEDYNTLLDTYGFTDKHVEQIGFTHTFADKTALANHFMTWLPHALNLSPEESFPCAREIADAIAQDTQRTEQIPLTTSVLHISAYR